MRGRERGWEREVGWVVLSLGGAFSLDLEEGLVGVYVCVRWREVEGG